MTDLIYVLKFALSVIEENNLQDIKNDDNWVLGEAIDQQLTLCDVSNTEGKLQAVEDLKDLCYDVCPLYRRDDLSEILSLL